MTEGNEIISKYSHIKSCQSYFFEINACKELSKIKQVGWHSFSVWSNEIKMGRNLEEGERYIYIWKEYKRDPCHDDGCVSFGRERLHQRTIRHDDEIAKIV